MSVDNSDLANRMKEYEGKFSARTMPLLPVLCRLDGRSFHNFTKGLKRPYDLRLSSLMQDTTRYLVEETNARCGYTQSDEITLLWYTETYDSEILFNGKIPKLTSVLSAMATAFFNRELKDRIPEKADQMPLFDNRVWEVPNLMEAVNVFVWREQDAVRNSIQMAARSLFSHNECDCKNTSELQEMLFTKGVNWNDYPSFFRRGSYFQRKTRSSPFTAEELAALPPKHNARQNPGLIVTRSYVEQVDLPPLTKISNQVDVIVYGDDPKTKIAA